MSAVFPNTSDNLFIEKIQKKKEIISANITHKKSDDVDEYIKDHGLLQWKEHQILERRVMNPLTEYKAILLQLLTGGGKTLASLGIALEFNKIYKREWATAVSEGTFKEMEGNNIFIIGFTESIFKNELISRPELGFVTKEEVKRKRELQNLASVSEQNKDRYVEYIKLLKRRLSNKFMGGHFKFIGYKKLVNLLFKNPKKVVGLSNKEISEKIGKELEIDERFVRSFRNSIAICDEIHNVYNSLEINNYGSTLQYILKNTNVRAVFLSATPLTNKPTEIVDLIHLLTGEQLNKDKVFDKKNETLSLTSYGEKSIKELTRGRISYLFKKDERFFPEEILVGQPIMPGNSKDFIRFIFVTASKTHYNVMKQAKDAKYVKGDDLDEDTDDKKLISKDSRYLNDFIFPTKEGYGYSKYDLSQIDEKTKSRYKIDISNLKVLTGDFLDNLSLYSAKYEKVVHDLFSILKGPNNGKIMIYHRYVRMSGILFIREILLHLGFIEDGMTETDNTISADNGIPKKKFLKMFPKKKFNAARFITIYSDLTKEQINKMIDRFNAINNSEGDHIKLILGSNIIREGLDFKAIRHLMITHIPDNISMYNQIKGRGIRRGSHMSLPPEKRNIRIYTYVYKNSPEEKRYINKIKDHLLIEKIQQIMKNNAIDRELYERNGNLGVKLNQIDTTSFDAFYSDDEINEIIVVIKRLFLVQDSWKYEQLWKAVKNPPFTVYVNSELFEQRNFNIALHLLIYQQDNVYELNKNDSIYNALQPNLRLIYKHGISMILIHVGEYYTLVPFNEELSAPIVDYYYTEKLEKRTMDIKKFLSKQSHSEGYNDKKNHLMNKFIDATDTQFEDVTCSYGIKFQISLLEEVIEYMINLFLYNKINPKYHLFYYKLWNYYNKIGYVINARNANNYCDKYKPYVMMNTKSKIDLSTAEKFQKTTSKLKPTKKHNIVRSDSLPIGHFLDEVAKLYDMKEGWFLAYDYNYHNNQKIIENDIIIGFYDKSETGIDLKFKLRPPIHRIKTKDLTRKEERGKVCYFNDKEELLEIAERLGIPNVEDSVKNDICTLIKNKLIENENKEICKCLDKRIKWFYRHFESQPI